jgi:hypothetical protein
MLTFLYRSSRMRSHTMPIQVMLHLFWMITTLGLASPTAVVLAVLAPLPQALSPPTLLIAEFDLTSRMHRRLASTKVLCDLHNIRSTSVTSQPCIPTALSRYRPVVSWKRAPAGTELNGTQIPGQQGKTMGEPDIRRSAGLKPVRLHMLRKLYATIHNQARSLHPRSTLWSYRETHIPAPMHLMHPMHLMTLLPTPGHNLVRRHRQIPRRTMSSNGCITIWSILQHDLYVHEATKTMKEQMQCVKRVALVSLVVKPEHDAILLTIVKGVSI